jgi:hypothetical protein
MLLALIVLIGFASRAWRRWPRTRDLAVIVFGNVVMSALVLPMREQDPGLSTLVLQVAAGAAVYAFVVLGLDIAGLQSLAFSRLRLTFARLKTLPLLRDL